MQHAWREVKQWLGSGCLLQAPLGSAADTGSRPSRLPIRQSMTRRRGIAATAIKQLWKFDVDSHVYAWRSKQIKLLIGGSEGRNLVAVAAGLMTCTDRP